MITIPSTGKPCIKCGERNGNPLHDGVCNVCYTNSILGDPDSKKQTADKILGHGKNIVSIVFGVIALLWFIVMLPAQSDFMEIVIGWAVIGVIYLVFRSKIGT